MYYEIGGNYHRGGFESGRSKDLFEPIVTESRRDRRLEHARTWLGAEPGRLMANEIYRDSMDPDGHFGEQFQSTGFDARVFELYLYAYFSRSGYEVKRPRPNPDFVVQRGGAHDNSIANLDSYRWRKHCNGLFQTPAAA